MLHVGLQDVPCASCFELPHVPAPPFFGGLAGAEQFFAPLQAPSPALHPPAFVPDFGNDDEIFDSHDGTLALFQVNVFLQELEHALHVPVQLIGALHQQLHA